MSVVFLNGRFLPQHEAQISPLDRGFLFGDGVYEVIPSYAGRTVGLNGHLARLANGLQALGIQPEYDEKGWKALIDQLLAKNPQGNWGVYLQVSRGTDNKRHHGYPKDLKPTVFMFLSPINGGPTADPDNVKGLEVITSTDMRWHRCHIKSTSLLGNVMHYQQSYGQGKDETLLINDTGHVTEFSTANVFVVSNEQIVTPPLDNQLLPGITRQILLQLLAEYTDYSVCERPITLNELKMAQEVWITSSSREVMPVTRVDEQAISDGQPGKVWRAVIDLYAKYKYQY